MWLNSSHNLLMTVECKLFKESGIDTVYAFTSVRPLGLTSITVFRIHFAPHKTFPGNYVLTPSTHVLFIFAFKPQWLNHSKFCQEKLVT